MENSPIHAPTMPLHEPVQRNRLSYCHFGWRFGAGHKQSEARKDTVACQKSGEKTLSFAGNPSVGIFVVPVLSGEVFYELSTNNANFLENPINSGEFWHKVCLQTSQEIQFCATALGNECNSFAINNLSGIGGYFHFGLGKRSQQMT